MIGGEPMAPLFFFVRGCEGGSGEMLKKIFWRRRCGLEGAGQSQEGPPVPILVWDNVSRHPYGAGKWDLGQLTPRRGAGLKFLYAYGALQSEAYRSIRTFMRSPLWEDAGER